MAGGKRVSTSADEVRAPRVELSGVRDAGDVSDVSDVSDAASISHTIDVSDISEVAWVESC